MEKVLVSLIRGYRYLLSPLLGCHCRFHPTCSEYALLAIQQHGTAYGLWLSCKRLLRCNPWHPGGYDPVPRPRAAITSSTDHG